MGREVTGALRVSGRKGSQEVGERTISSWRASWHSRIWKQKPNGGIRCVYVPDVVCLLTCSA